MKEPIYLKNCGFFYNVYLSLVTIQGRRDDFESGGARYQYRESGPLSSKKVGGPDYMFYPISTKKWGGPGPPGPYPYYAPGPASAPSLFDFLDFSLLYYKHTKENYYFNQS